MTEFCQGGLNGTKISPRPEAFDRCRYRRRSNRGFCVDCGSAGNGNNGGVFPEEKITNAINGTSEVGAHGTEGGGTTPMPVWGLAFRASTESGTGADFTPQEVDKKIMLLVDYIKTIQEK